MVAYVRYIVGLILFLGVYTELYIGDSSYVVPLAVIVPIVGGWVHIPVCTLFYCNFVLVNCFGPTM